MRAKQLQKGSSIMILIWIKEINFLTGHFLKRKNFFFFFLPCSYFSELERMWDGGRGGMSVSKAKRCWKDRQQTSEQME